MGDASKAREKLGWIPKIDFLTLIKDMIHSDIKEVEKTLYLKDGGYRTSAYFD